MHTLITNYFVDIEGKYPNKFYQPTNEILIKDIGRILNFDFPVDLIEFFKFSNGYEGFVGKNYLILYGIEEIRDDIYNNKEFHPWAIQIGSNGGGEMFVVFMKDDIYYYGMLPMIGEDKDLILLGNTFEEFIRHLFLSDFWQTD